jgi:hypothetical protein
MEGARWKLRNRLWPEARAALRCLASAAADIFYPNVNFGTIRARVNHALEAKDRRAARSFLYKFHNEVAQPASRGCLPSFAVRVRIVKGTGEY